MKPSNAALLGRGPIAALSVLALAAVCATAVLAPVLTGHDAEAVDALNRLRPPDLEHLLGTDAYGRDVLARLAYGGRVSLGLGFLAAVLCVGVGLAVGLVCGFMPRVDAVLMRIVDGMMAIPSVLLAITIVALAGAGFWTVLAAITVPETPRVVRMVRSVTLSSREEPYIEAARGLGSSTARIIRIHLLPGVVGPLLVQGTYICAAAILTESVLSFLGTGINPEIPTWGNIMADGRNYFLVRPEFILWPGLLLSITILSVNLIGDVVRDALDPKLAKGRTSR